MSRFPTFFAASDCSLLARIGDGISPEIRQRVLHSMRILLSNRLPAVRNLHPAYDSILISFDPLTMNHEKLGHLVRSLLENEEKTHFSKVRIVEIPTVYGGQYGPDLDDVARRCGLANEEVIRAHSAVTYTVYFLGFSPGFPYLGGMSENIATPRLPSPRKNVPAGSVAIGGNQTGIYPLESPGGWRIIGRTPLRLFDPSRSSPTLLLMGDQVRFVSISDAEFTRLYSG